MIFKSSWYNEHHRSDQRTERARNSNYEKINYVYRPKDGDTEADSKNAASNGKKNSNTTVNY